MDNPAPPTNQRILLTNVGTFLGSRLAQKLTGLGYEVYGVGKKHPNSLLLESSNFTFLDLDLGQPLPDHLPTINTLVHIDADGKPHIESAQPKISPQSQRVVDLAASTGSTLLFASDVRSIENIADIINTNNDQIKFIGLGHIYGPNMDLQDKAANPTAFFDNNELMDLIRQAVTTDKIVMENEGTDIIYPTYIDDALDALVSEITSERNNKNIRIITSSQAQSALSISYEIQKKAHVILQKELSLYFAGPENHTASAHQPQIKTHSILEKRHSLGEGLEKTLLYFRDKSAPDKQAKNPLKKEEETIPSGKTEAGPQITLPDKSQKIKLNRGLMPKMPHLGGKFKKALILAVILTVIFIARLAFNLVQGTTALVSAKESLTAANFKESQDKAQNALGHLSSAQKNISWLTAPLKFTNPAKGLNSGVQSLAIGASALLNFSRGTEIIAQNLSGITAANSTKTGLDLETPIAYLTKAYFESEYARTLAQNASSSPIFKSKFRQTEEALTSLAQLARSAQELTILTPDIVGGGKDKTYLVLLVNNAELRPGGGFIGNFAEISFKNNKLEKVEVEDIYTIDGQLREVIAAPAQLTQKLGVKQLYLRDSNWSTDFRVNAQTARDLYKKETGKTVDGVIAIDLTLLENLLAKIGPITLADYNEEITSTNLLEKGQYYSEVGFFPGSTQKRDFFATLTANLLAKIFDSLSSGNSQVGNAPWMALVGTMSQGLSEKHVMLALDGENLNSLVKSKGWDNPLPPETYNPKDNTGSTRDFLAISEANIGANKVNRYIKRTVAYDMTIGRDADLVGTLNITYKNESPADTWPAGTYVNYLRITTPANSTLETYSLDGKEIDINRLERGKIVPVVETTQVGELTQFATLVEIPVKQTKTLTFKYRIPKNIKLETAPTYELYISKQPGTLSDPLKFTFNLPGYLKIDSVNSGESERGKQNLTIETNLSLDRHFEIKVSKK